MYTTIQNPDHVEYGDPEALGTVARSVHTNSKGEVLVPQPSNDPNDPLNWSSWQKYSLYLTVCFFVVLATTNSSCFTVAIRPLSEEFNTSPTRAGYLVCFNVLLLGVGNLFWVPLMRVVGKRPVYLASLLLLMGTNVWSYEAHSFGSLLASRIVSGFAASASDATVPSLVADIFFVHERGHCMMMFHMALSAGFFVGPFVCAWIVQGAGWRWTCGVLAIASGATFAMGVFTIHETNYAREKVDFKAPREAYAPKRSFVQELGILRGYNAEESFFRTLIRILSMVVYPPMFWTGLTVGVFVGWNIIVQLTSSQTFTRPPYNWEIGLLGCLALAGFIGALFAFFVGGRLIDIIASRMTKANGGVRQPEFRLPAIIVPAVIGPMGILLYGLCVAHHTTWVGPAFGYAMQGFGLTAVSNVVVTYAVDGYQPITGESLVVVFVIRNTIGTLLALYTTDWQGATGIQNAFGEMVGIQYFIILLVIPMYFYGKQIRAWTETFGPAKHMKVPKAVEANRSPDQGDEVEEMQSSNKGPS